MPGSRWTFLTNHGHVLACLAADPAVRLREVAATVGISERAVQAILADLVEAGYVERERLGRCNHYRVREDGPLRHPLHAGHHIGELLQALAPAPEGYAATDAG